MSEREVVVVPDAELLARSTASRLLLAVLDAQSLRSPVHVVLTGGTVGIRTLAAVADDPVRRAVDWSGVHLWWGDERFVPTGDPDRNETQARQALVAALADVLPAAQVHPMAGPDGADDPESSAAAYAAELAAAAAPGALVPAFDVLMLGMGPDGHVASLFPGHPGMTAPGVTVGVHGSPKPPPQRVSLTFGAINAARQVWVVAAGREKSDAVARALAGDEATPAARVHGTQRTLWLLDAAAAGA